MGNNVRSRWEKFWWGELTREQQAPLRARANVAVICIALLLLAVIAATVNAIRHHDSGAPSSNCQSAFNAMYDAGYADPALNAAYDSACANADKSQLVRNAAR